MPELPEVETVRRGLETVAVGRTIASVEVFGPRTVRRHAGGPADFVNRLRGRRVQAAERRGKYLWLRLDDGAALLAHLGMSGQFLAVPAGTPDPAHLRARFGFADAGPELRFVDQRTFGGLSLDDLALDDLGEAVPATVAHIALDPLDPAFDRGAVFDRLRRRRTGVKRALLDQSLVSGVGNIYADEALWRARLHYARGADTLRRADAERLFDAVDEVFAAALRAGGTSFDSLYVAVNGESGWFERSLEVYGREGEPCSRCGAAIRREPFMNRSSYRCPRCQRTPREPRWVTGPAEGPARLTIWLSGRVQGVGMRWWIRSRALELGLAGWARNTEDGRVEVVAEGSRTAAEELLELLRAPATGVASRLARPGRIDTVVERWSVPGHGDLSGFTER